MLIYGMLAVSVAMRDSGLSTLAARHVFPRLPVRHWGLSVPKRLRYVMQRVGAVLGMVLRIFWPMIELTQQASRPGYSTTNAPWWTSSLHPTFGRPQTHERRSKQKLMQG